MLGGYLAAGGAGAINHYLERERDARMARTCGRPLVAGRIEPLASGRALFESTFLSVLPAALASGITTKTDADAALAAIGRDAIRHADRPVLWPLLIGAWKRKEKE